MAPWVGQGGVKEAATSYAVESGLDGSDAVGEIPGIALNDEPGAFQMPSRRRVRLVDLRSYSGLRHSLSQHADEILTEYSSKQVEIMERVFRALGEVDSNGRILRRPLRLHTLAAEAEVSIDELNSILLPFRSRSVGFVTPYGSSRLKAESIVDIGHEALLRCWSRVNDATLDYNNFPNGWLQRETRRRTPWRLLKAQADVFVRFDEMLSAPMLSLYDRSRVMLLGGEKWSERYGNDWYNVQLMIAGSRNTTTSSMGEKVCATHNSIHSFYVCRRLFL